MFLLGMTMVMVMTGHDRDRCWSVKGLWPTGWPTDGWPRSDRRFNRTLTDGWPRFDRRFNRFLNQNLPKKRSLVKILPKPFLPFKKFHQKAFFRFKNRLNRRSNRGQSSVKPSVKPRSRLRLWPRSVGQQIFDRPISVTVMTGHDRDRCHF